MLQSPPFLPGETVMTDFYDRKNLDNLKHKIIRCYKSDINCQTGWLVDAERKDGKVLDGMDSAWFRKVSDEKS